MNEQTSVSLNSTTNPKRMKSTATTRGRTKVNQAGLQENNCVMGATYYFFSNGVVNTTGTAPGATLTGTTPVTPGNWP
jgi:hypothetical protein